MAGVDLVLNGHNHNYQRTFPVTFNPNKASNPTVTDAFTTGYKGTSDGIVYAIVGTGGEGSHPLEGRRPYIATQFEGNFGFLDIEVSNGNPRTNLTGTFYDNGGSSIQDLFAIEKEIKDIKANSRKNIVEFQNLMVGNVSNSVSKKAKIPLERPNCRGQ